MHAETLGFCTTLTSLFEEWLECALLMEAGDYDEAELVYRADLGLDEKLPRPSQHPRNVWALHGLHECLVRRGEKVELQHVKLLLDQAVARADIPISASCLCRANAACP